MLVGMGIPENQIAVKTSNVDDLKGQDLMSRDCEIRYIITVNAMKEGWDCPFALHTGVSGQSYFHRGCGADPWQNPAAAVCDAAQLAASEHLLCVDELRGLPHHLGEDCGWFE